MKFVYVNGKERFETEDRAVFEDYILVEHHDVAREVMHFGIRFDLAEDDPLTELCTKIVDGEFADVSEGDLMVSGIDALIEDMISFGGNLDRDYSFYGIRIEE